MPRMPKVAILVAIFAGVCACYLALWIFFPWKMFWVTVACLVLFFVLMYFGERLGLVANDPDEKR